MTRLLISVRNVAEAELALAGGADLIDVKEPDRGSLGPADAETIRAVVDRVAGRVSTSAALGELLVDQRLDAHLAGRLQYAKYGLSDCANRPDWTTRWAQAVARLPEGVRPVAVIYADWKTARAPDPWSVLESAQAIGCGAVLVDTFDKSQGSLLAHWTLAEVEQFVLAVHRADLSCVIAGGLGLEEIAELLPLAPDFIAVRGAACRGDRTGQLDLQRIRRLSLRIKHATDAERAVRSV